MREGGRERGRERECVCGGGFLDIVFGLLQRLKRLYDLCRDTDNDRIIRHTFYDNGAGSDLDIVADFNITDNTYVCAEFHIVANPWEATDPDAIRSADRAALP